MKVVTAEQMRALDRRAMEEMRIPGVVLMENAGRAVVEVMARELGPLQGKRVAIFCGSGNNGGDGAVVARYLHLLGAKPTVWMAGRREALKADALAHWKMMQSLHIEVRELGGSSETSLLSAEAEPSIDIIVDALLGTGAKGAPRDAHAASIAFINRISSQCPVVAVDIPSGVDSDTGATPGEAVRAMLTVTFAYPKLGLFLFPGAACVGTLHVADIGCDWEGLEPATPFQVFAVPGLTSQIAASGPSGLGVAARLLQKRHGDANKGMFGHVAVVAGSRGMCGAPSLVARAAQHVGAGLVTVLAAESAQPIIAAKLDEQMTLPLPEEDGAICEAAFDAIAAFAEKATVLCVGPGLTTHPGTVALVQRLIVEIDKPLVLDADGLNALAQKPDIIARRAASPQAPLVLTPHPGEAARLLNKSIAQIEADRVGSVRELASRFGAIALLKGRYTLIADTRGDILINTTGNPGMATGSGDTLTGIIGGLLAHAIRLTEKSRADTPEESRTLLESYEKTVALAAYVHGLAGDIAAEEVGEAGLVAGDIITWLSRALRRLEDKC